MKQKQEIEITENDLSKIKERALYFFVETDFQHLNNPNLAVAQSYLWAAAYVLKDKLDIDINFQINKRGNKRRI